MQLYPFAVIFDMDGVLIDSHEAHYEAFLAFGKKLGVPFTREFFNGHIGMHNNQIFPLWLQRDLPAEVVQELADEKEALYRELAPRFVRPIAGAPDLVRTLAQSGLTLGVGSSGPRLNVELALDILKIRPFLRGVVTGDDVSVGKPNPEIFLKAAAKIQWNPGRCIVVEDAVSGVRAARSAGMKVIALTSSLPAEKLGEADVIVDSLDSISPETLVRLYEGH